MKMSLGETWNKTKSKKGVTFAAAEGGGGVGRVETGAQERTGEERKNGEAEGGGKTLVVGVRMDTQSREILTWALVNVADTGDRVVALHVLSSSGSPAAVLALALAKEFDTMLAAYEGFCNLKQIDLKLKLCKGSSIRKVLVREVKAFAASKLILGVTKNSSTVGSSWIAIAKHCAKKLPNNCSVLALSNGKIAFQREATETPEAHKKSSKDSPNSEVDDLHPSPHMVGQEGRNGQDSSPSIVSNNGSNGDGSSTVESDFPTSDASPKTCAICSPECPSPLNKLNDKQSLTSAPAKILKSPSRRSSLNVMKELPEVRPGWRSLRKFVLTNRRDVSSESPKASPIHWAMRLPHRHSSVHPDRKSAKSDVNEILNNATKKTNGTTLHLPSFHLRDENGRLPEELESLKENYSSVCRMFSYEELMHATSNFSPDKLIGKGGSSSVYKGCFSDGKEFAAKILKPSADAVKEFVSEIKIVTALRHKNIISVLGFCLDDNNLILVYDYISRGSLEEILHGEKVHKHLSWSERYKVAMGVAEALVYLHRGDSMEPVIHRDVKSSNILLSEDYEPQLSDFGLAKLASATTSQLASGGTAGTFGYLAPEFFQYGKVNDKTDVYAFGVVLLELIAGRKPITTDCPKGQESLVMWAKPFLLRGEFKELLDPTLGDEYDSDQVERMSFAASLCTRGLHQARPKMNHVLKLLQGDNDVVNWARTELSTPQDADGLDEELLNLKYNIQSHLSLALLDVEDDSLSTGSIDHTVDTVAACSSVEDYLRCRWSRSSSFN